MPWKVEPVLGDPGTYRRFLSDTAGGLLFLVTLLVALPDAWARDLILPMLGYWDGAPPVAPVAAAQFAILGVELLVGALVIGPVVNLMSYALEHTISVIARGYPEKLIRHSTKLTCWRNRVLSDLSSLDSSDSMISKIISATSGDMYSISRHFLMITSPPIFMAHERYQGIDILTRCAMLSSILLAALAPFHEFWPLILIFGLAGTLVFYYLGLLVSYYRHSRHAAALLALAAMTGDPELLDQHGRLPDSFEEDPGGWYRRLMQHYPLRPTEGGATMASVPPSSSGGT